MAFNPRSLLERAIELHQGGYLAEAEELYREVLSRQRRNFDALHMLGVAKLAAGQGEQALGYLDRALSVRRDHPEAHYHRGMALLALARHADAVTSFDRVLRLEPGHFEAHNNRGVALAVLGRHEEAIASFDAALVRAPGYAQARFSRAWSLKGLGRFDSSLGEFEAILASDPRHREAMIGRARILELLLRPDDAIAQYDAAIGLWPDDPVLPKLLGHELADVGREAEALAAYRQALALQPDSPEVRTAEALVRLGQGDFARGWAAYEWHYREPRNSVRLRPHAQPEWHGEPPTPERRLLVWGEQGIGDEILYAGMVADLAERGAPLVLECASRLAALFGRSFASVVAVPRSDPPHPLTRERSIAWQAPAASLGAYLRYSADEFQQRRAYLRADPRRRDHWRRTLCPRPGKPLIGLSWRSVSANVSTEKSLALDAFAPMLRAGEAAFTDLQYGDTDAERERCLERTGVRISRAQGVDFFRDLDEVAAVVAACDLVITISNVNAHFAGAQGVPGWVLLPRGQGQLYYWMREGERTPWYPSLRIFRQAVPGRWTECIDAVARELARALESGCFDGGADARRD